MCTDTSLPALDVIRLYGPRFKIDLAFKHAMRQLSAFAYHFRMFDMKPRRRNDGNQQVHRSSPKYREDVNRQLHTCHVFIQAGLICQGLQQYLSVPHSRLVRTSFSSWLRTVHLGIPPSELVVGRTLRETLPEFPLDSRRSNIFKEFLSTNADTRKMAAFQLAA